MFKSMIVALLALTPVLTTAVYYSTMLTEGNQEISYESANRSNHQSESINEIQQGQASLQTLSHTATPRLLQASCKANQVINPVTGQCQCDSSSVLFDNVCFRCPTGSYKDSQTCTPCLDFCLSCVASGQCTQCEPGRAFDAFLSACKVEGSGDFGGTGTTACASNQVLVDNRCQCDSFSIEVSQGACFRCVLGSYKQGPLCLPCDDRCNQCTNSTSCLSCLSPYTLNTRTLSCQAAAPTCRADQVLVNNTCECPGRSVQFNNQCVQCPAPTYKDPLSRTCQACAQIEPQCATCSNASVCLTCAGNLRVGALGRCECLAPFFDLEAGCLQCPPGFAYVAQLRTCINPNLTTTNSSNGTTGGNTTNTTTNTSTATNNSASSNTTTVTNTTNGEVNNTKSNTTNTSSNAANTTITCRQNQVFQQGQCFCNEETVNTTGQCLPCPGGTFKFGDFCIDCPQDCLRCTTFIDCLQCKQNHTFNAFFNLCEPNCTTNQVLQDGACTCDQASTRNAQGVCQPCSAGTVKSNNTCTPCPSNCLVCSTPAICTQCSTGFALNLVTSRCCGVNERYSGTGLRCECETGFRNITGTCGVCPEGRVYVQTTQLCVQSTPVPPIVVCGNKEVLLNGTCTCTAGTARVNGSCQSCPASQYIQSGQCRPCLANCLSCSGPQSCLQCQSNYTGTSCQLCALAFRVLTGVVPQVCVREVCGDGVLSAGEECDDGGRVAGDGCTGACQIENGYVCGLRSCTRLVEKTEESINSVGVVMGFRFVQPGLASSANLTQVKVTNGTSPSSVRVVRPPGDASSVKVLLDYCGLLPEEIILVELVSSSQAGTVRYVSEYDLDSRVVIPRATVSKSVKQPDAVLA